MEDENAESLSDLLKTLSYIKQIKQTETVYPYTLASKNALSEDWLAEEDDELQKMS